MTFDVDQLRARHAHCAPAICTTLQACDEIEVLRDQLWWWIARNSTTAAEVERLRTIVAALIEEPADTNTRSANGATPHTQSVECGAKNDPGERSQHSPGPADPDRRIDDGGE